MALYGVFGGEKVGEMSEKCNFSISAAVSLRIERENLAVGSAALFPPYFLVSRLAGYGVVRGFWR